MHPIRSWSAAAPITMSAIVLMLMATDALFGLNPLPIHDEGAIDHIAMILMFGQVPIILYFVFNGRREIKRILPVLATQLSLGAIIFAAVHYSDHASEALVARRIRDRLPIPGSEALLRGKLEPLGPLQSLTFKGVDRIGWDIYAARFADGDQEWRIFSTPNGKIHGLTQIEGRHGCRSSEVYECRYAVPNLP